MDSWTPPLVVCSLAVLLPVIALLLAALPGNDSAPIGATLSAILAELIILNSVLRRLPLTLNLTNVIAVGALFIGQSLLPPSTGSIPVQIALDLSWMAAIIAVVMTLDRASAAVLRWDARHPFHWKKRSVRLYWFLGVLAMWCYFAWSELFAGSLLLGRPADELLNGFVTDFIAALTGVLLLIAVYAVLWTAYRSNLEPPWIVDHGYWHVRLNALLDVFVAGTTIVIGVGGVFLGLYAGLGVDPDPERRDAGNTGALTAVTVLLLVIALRTWHKYYRESEVRAELKHLRVTLANSALHLQASADALRASNLMHSNVLRGQNVLRDRQDHASHRTDQVADAVDNHDSPG